MFRLLDGLSDEDHSSGSQDLDNSQDTGKTFAHGRHASLQTLMQATNQAFTSFNV